MSTQYTYLLGPCAAESRQQVLETAKQLTEHAQTFIFRAGAWKPRTSPDSFQGAGAEALEWLQEVKCLYGLEVATEVATPEHVRLAADAGIDYLWIGARTSANPIAVSAVAEAITQYKGNPLKGVLIKNPVNADADLWIGNIARLERTGVPVTAVHRGCNHRPCWAMAHEVRTKRPDIPMLLDPSHMSGEASQVQPLMAYVESLGLDGAMIEVHCCPQKALSDAKQQILPACLRLESERKGAGQPFALNWLRAEIDELDDRLWTTVAARMDVSRRIGEWKKANGVQPLQPQRYQEILAHRKEWAAEHGLPADFVERVFNAIHEESLKKQE